MANFVQIEKDLNAIYLPLVGMTFEAIYQGPYVMPQTGNLRDILVVNSQDPVVATLGNITNAVLNMPNGTQVWKGITGPGGSHVFTHYWLWVEPDFNGVLQEGLPYQFRIVEKSVFPCFPGTFSCGVSIKATRLIPMPVPNTVLPPM